MNIPKIPEKFPEKMVWFKGNQNHFAHIVTTTDLN